jgi:hypothetical protein
MALHYYLKELLPHYSSNQARGAADKNKLTHKRMVPADKEK